MRVLRAALAVTLSLASSAFAQVIDDFESYTGTPDLQAAWLFATSLDTTTPTLGAGAQSLRREGATAGDGTGVFVGREFDPPLDLSGLPGLEVRVRRDPASVSTVRFAIFARDGSNFSCGPQDEPLISDSEWHSSILSFPEFCGAVNLADIVQITLNVTNKSGLMDPGDVIANFDDLQAALLQDGFESGDTSRWSATVP
jgi:hypothetical protein